MCSGECIHNPSSYLKVNPSLRKPQLDFTSCKRKIYVNSIVANSPSLYHVSHSCTSSLMSSPHHLSSCSAHTSSLHLQPTSPPSCPVHTSSLHVQSTPLPLIPSKHLLPSCPAHTNLLPAQPTPSLPTQPFPERSKFWHPIQVLFLQIWHQRVHFQVRLLTSNKNNVDLN